MQRRPDMPPPLESMNAKLNWLRAGVLGANDGIVSTSALMVGVAGAGMTAGGILTAGIAALVAGAFSMGVGEYVSVSSQRDSEKAAIERERALLAANPDGQRDQLAHMYEARGLTPGTAQTVADELSEGDALGAHLEVEYGLDPDDLNNPWAAALSSAVAFTLGALVPLLATVLFPSAWAPWPIVIATGIALIVTGVVSARIGDSGKRLATVRVFIGGMLALAATWAIGALVGTPIA